MSTTTASEPRRRFPWGKPVALARALAKQGIDPGRLALALALGATFGTAPCLWGSTLACALVAARFGLNQGAIQLANYLALPVQLALFIPFVRLGRTLFAPSARALDIETLHAAFRQDAFAAAHSLGLANLQAIGAWALLAPLLFVLLRRVLLAIIRRRGLKTARQRPLCRGT
jgi:hypothetical protein